MQETYLLAIYECQKYLGHNKLLIISLSNSWRVKIYLTLPHVQSFCLGWLLINLSKIPLNKTVVELILLN